MEINSKMDLRLQAQTISALRGLGPCSSMKYGCNLSHGGRRLSNCLLFRASMTVIQWCIIFLFLPYLCLVYVYKIYKFDTDICTWTCSHQETTVLVLFKSMKHQPMLMFTWQGPLEGVSEAKVGVLMLLSCQKTFFLSCPLDVSPPTEVAPQLHQTSVMVQMYTGDV